MYLFKLEFRLNICAGVDHGCFLFNARSSVKSLDSNHDPSSSRPALTDKTHAVHSILKRR